MNKKVEVIKLIIYLVGLAITVYFFLRIKDVSEQQWVCITGPCPQMGVEDVMPWYAVCFISSIVFTVLAIRSIIRIKKK